MARVTHHIRLWANAVKSMTEATLAKPRTVNWDTQSGAPEKRAASPERTGYMLNRAPKDSS